MLCRRFLLFGLVVFWLGSIALLSLNARVFALGGEPAAKEEVKPADAGPERLRVKPREIQTEEELRKQLLTVPEESLKAAELPRLVEKYASNYTASRGLNLEPTPLLGLRPDFKQLPIIQGDRCRLSPSAAERLTVLSQKMHRYLEGGAPTDAKTHAPDPVLLREILRLENRGKRPEWVRPEAIPVLRQMLSFRDKPLRLMLVELLEEIPGKDSSFALAMLAVFDIAPEVRAAALAALIQRPREDYRAVMLRGLRYPFAPAADHAAEALVKLDDRQAVPQLVNLLQKPEPNTPFMSSKNRLVVRELVQINHQANCLMCHAPAVTLHDPVPGLVPGLTVISSRTESGGYGASAKTPTSTVQNRPLWVRADVAYLRQDFSISHPIPVVLAGMPINSDLRVDYLVRIRPLTDKEVKKVQSEHRTPGESRQRQALLFALRELAREDRGVTFEDWKDLAGEPEVNAIAEAKVAGERSPRKK
jgi:hypothetical protein